MNGFKEYLKGYVGGVKSLLVGMRTSMKVFCQKKITEQYPENPPYYTSHSGTSPGHAGDAGG